MSGGIPDKDQKILYAKCGNRCAIPDCRKTIVVEKTEKDRESLVSQMAHIRGEKPTSPRYDNKMTDKQRNSHENLIVVCNNCHKIIDDQWKTYTVEKLLEIKNNHEKWVIESTEKELINITFAELDIVTKYLISDQYTSLDSYVLVPPKEKIKKNELSPKIEHLITTGLTQAKQVEQFIDKSLDMEFGERLKQGFVSEYERLRNKERLRGDDLFNTLLDFASRQYNKFLEKAACLAVLVYLFEKCEVFEK